MADLIEIGISVQTNIKNATADLDKMGGSVVNNIRTIDRLESEFKQLSRELDRGKLSSAAYQKGVNQINNELLNFQRNAEKASQVEKRFGESAATGGKSLNRFNMTLQQGGYQLQDFVVQLQGGTSFFTAFSQQGSQFASIFGPKGAVIGALIAIGSAAAAMSLGFLGGQNALEALKKDLESSETALDDFTDALKESSLSAEKMGESYGGANTYIKGTLSLLADLKRQVAQQNLDKLAEDMIGLFGVGGDGYQGAAVADFFDINAFFSINADTRRNNRSAIAEFQSAQEQLNNSSNDTQRLDALLRMQEAAKALAEINGEITDEEAELVAQIATALLQQQKFTSAVDGSAESLVDLNERYFEGNELIEAGRRATLARNRLNRSTIIDLEQELKLAETSLRYGQDSAEVARLRAEQEGISKNLTEANLAKYIDLSMQIWNAADLTGQAADKAKAMADALRDAASAMSSLQGFGLGLDRTLAVSVSKVEALKAGTDAAIAGQIAGYRLDLEAKTQAALSAGADPLQVRVESAIDRGVIDQIEASETQRKALEEAQREADRASNKADKDSPLEKLQKELDLQRELVGQSEAYVKVRQALGDDYAETSPKIISDLQAQYAETQKLIEIEEQRQSIIGKVESTMESAFMSMVDGTASVKDAFKSMARAIIKDLYEGYVMQQIVGSAKLQVLGLSVGCWQTLMVVPSQVGRVTPFANGGVVGGPTYFPMAGGKTGLMGEAGPEAIMPLKRGANGKLGVSVEGGSGSVVVNNNINVTGGSDPAAIRMEVAKLMPQITSATKSAVIDARRRGGQMKAAFG
jgi:hypothetical protein